MAKRGVSGCLNQLIKVDAVDRLDDLGSKKRNFLCFRGPIINFIHLNKPFSIY